MARFIFRFAANLRVKERIEEQKKIEYGKALAALETEKQKKARMLLEREETIASFRESVNKLITPADVQTHNNYLGLLKAMVIKQDETIKKCEETAEIKRLELVEAMKQRKIMEKLKEKDRERFIREEQLREQKIQDETVSYRYSRA